MTDAQKAQAALLLHGSSAGGVDRTVRSSLEGNIRNQQANEWLAPPSGRLSSPEAAQRWLDSPDFATWYKSEFGKDFTGSTSLKRMDQATVKSILEKAIPSTASRFTAYGDMVQTQRLSDQMATMLREGKLPPAEYRPDGV